MDRGERRQIKEKKWINKLKKLWKSGALCHIYPVKSSKVCNYDELDKGESWDDFKHDKFGVLWKNTSTAFKYNKRLSTREEKKRNKNNRELSTEDINELNDCIENMNNKYAFENYCGACDNFNTFDCQFLDKVFDNTEWKKIKCDNFCD